MQMFDNALFLKQKYRDPLKSEQIVLDGHCHDVNRNNVILSTNDLNVKCSFSQQSCDCECYSPEVIKYSVIFIVNYYKE